MTSNEAAAAKVERIVREAGLEITAFKGLTGEHGSDKENDKVCKFVWNYNRKQDTFVQWIDNTGNRQGTIDESKWQGIDAILVNISQATLDLNYERGGTAKRIRETHFLFADLLQRPPFFWWKSSYRAAKVIDFLMGDLQVELMRFPGIYDWRKS